MFEAFYQSTWQQPGLLVAVPVVLSLFLPRRRTFLAIYLWAVTTLAVVDAVATSSWLALPSPLASALGLGFVLLGDARIFVLTERFGGSASGLGWLWRAVLLTAPVPLAQAGLLALFPELFDNPRHTYLAYECLFVLWLSLYRWGVLSRRTLAPAERSFVTLICHCALGYYALWAVADLWILSGADAGYALRVVPNVLYYGSFPLFVHWISPSELE